MARYLIGIDEAGRGPLAGPVSVGAVIIRRDFDMGLLEGVRDSKQLTPLVREAWYGRMLALRRSGNLRFAVAFSSAHSIDRRGIVPSVRAALARCLIRIEAEPRECEILLDGSLYAPARFTLQKTIIRGDETEPLISLASIAAKVTRDRLMVRLSRRFPAYGFDAHKGYGTAAHCRRIRDFGFCALHRKTFCKNLLLGPNSV